MSRLVKANYVRVSFIDSVQAKPMFCPERTGGSCWSAACWRYARWSATRRLSWWWSQPWSSTPSTTTSPWGRNWSFSACRPPSSIATITMPTTTSGRLTSQHNLFLDDWCDAQAICFSVQQVDADGKCWSTTAMEYFQPGVWDYIPMKQHLHRAVHEAFYETLFYFLPSLFFQLTITSQHQRHHRFCLRLLLKHPDSHALCVLCGHNAMVSGSFKHALGSKQNLW